MVIAEDSRSFDAVQFLEKVQKLSPLTVRMILMDEIDGDRIKSAVNRSQAFKIFDTKSFSKNWKEYRKSALELNEQAWSKSQLMKISNQQLREQEALNNNLEKTVEERTTHIQLSKEEEEEKLNKVRQLIRFIRDLSETSSFEEILMVIRREFRKIDKIGEPHLLFNSANSTDVVTFSSGYAKRIHFKQMLAMPSDISWNDPNVTRQLANDLGRPLMRMISIPLPVGSWQKIAGKGSQATLCIENSLSESEVSQFLDFALERMRPISLVVDKTMLETDMALQSIRWEKTFDGLKDPIAIIGDDYKVLRSNRKFNDNLDLKSCFQIFANRETPCESCVLKQTLSDGKTRVEKIKIGNKIFELHSYPISWNPQAKATHAVHQYVDQTQSRELYMRMLQSEKMGAIGLLAGNIAHELNNPLTGLHSMAQVLKSQAPPNSELAQDLHEIEKATVRSQRIIHHLMEFSQGNSPELIEATLDEIVERTLPLLRTMTRIHKFEIHLESEKYLLKLDPQLIQQVVFNLVNNACQAMVKSGELIISTNVDSDKKFIVLSVQDTGPGIPPPIQERIFEPFFTTKKEGEGTGLGLSLAKDIVEEWGGRIEFQSETGKGTIFKVFLPIASVRK